MKHLRLGIIGCGGRSAVAVYTREPKMNASIAACHDIDERRFPNMRKLFGDGIHTTTDLAEFLRHDLDAVFITSPDFAHEEHAVAALNAGVGVYLEKPMAITIEGCDNILRASKRTGAKLFVGHNMRYMALFRKMKQLIDEGAIGEVKSVWCRHFISYGGDAYFRDWHAESRNTTGLLLQKGAHDIDVIHWLSGHYSRRVSAFGNLAVYGGLPRREPGAPGGADWKSEHWPPLEQKNFNPVMDVEDQSVMIMELEGGVMGAYLQCHFTPDSCRNYTIIGTEGRMENLGDAPNAPISIWNKRRDEFRRLGDKVHRGRMLKGGHGGADPKIVEEFLSYVRAEGPYATTATPLDARMSVAAGYQATMSLRDGGTPREVPAVVWDRNQ